MAWQRETAPKGKVRYAVVGLGWISQAALLPGFANAKGNSELTALVSDDPEKLREIGDEYRVAAEHRYSYDDYDRCLNSGAVDAVYIGLPNDMHREYTERAARAGVHVLCEKPMANTEEECRAMIDACASADVRLMIAYRLHLEEANLAAIEAIKEGQIGEPKYFSSCFSQPVEEGNIRLDKAKGGGPLNDIGVYCINAARYLLRSEPTEAVAFRANSGDPRFTGGAEGGVDELIAATLRFPGGRLAQFTVSFNTANVGAYQVVGTKGDLRMDPGYSFEGERRMALTIDGKTTETKYKKRDQFGAQLEYFSNCVLERREPEPSGMEGLADIRIINALHRSAEANGLPQQLDQVAKGDRPDEGQLIKKPAVSTPEMVNASSPRPGK